MNDCFDSFELVLDFNCQIFTVLDAYIAGHLCLTSCINHLINFVPSLVYINCTIILGGGVSAPVTIVANYGPSKSSIHIKMSIYVGGLLLMVRFSYFEQFSLVNILKYLQLTF